LEGTTSQEDEYLFNLPLEELLKKPMRYLTKWIKQADRLLEMQLMRNRRARAARSMVIANLTEDEQRRQNNIALMAQISMRNWLRALHYRS
jgi:hypothetical protein